MFCALVQCWVQLAKMTAAAWEALVGSVDRIREVQVLVLYISQPLKTFHWSYFFSSVVEVSSSYRASGSLLSAT